MQSQIRNIDKLFRFSLVYTVWNGILILNYLFTFWLWHWNSCFSQVILFFPFEMSRYCKLGCRLKKRNMLFWNRQCFSQGLHCTELIIRQKTASLWNKRNRAALRSTAVRAPLSPPGIGQRPMQIKFASEKDWRACSTSTSCNSVFCFVVFFTIKIPSWLSSLCDSHSTQNLEIWCKIKTKHSPLH